MRRYEFGLLLGTSDALTDARSLLPGSQEIATPPPLPGRSNGYPHQRSIAIREVRCANLRTRSAFLDVRRLDPGPLGHLTLQDAQGSRTETNTDPHASVVTDLLFEERSHAAHGRYGPAIPGLGEDIYDP